MHDVACSLRPRPDAALTPAPGPGAPRLDRVDPYGAFTETWFESFPFMFTTAATSAETQRSRVIHGPFRIVNLTSNSQGAVAELDSLGLFVSDDDTAATSQLTPAGPTFAPMAGDTTTQQGGFPSQTSYLAVPLGYIHRGGTGRIIVVYNNTNAATRAVMALVTIVHMRRCEPGERPERY